MIGELQITRPFLQVLDESLLGELTTTEIRIELRHRLPLGPDDFRPLRNRSDQTFDQIVRNLKSHKDVPGNPIYEGYAIDVPRGFRITRKGRELLRSRKVRD